MSKSSSSFYIKDEYLDKMDEQNINKSELVNDLLGQYFGGESHVEQAIREYQIKDLSLQEQTLEQRLELIKSQQDQLREMEEKQDKKYNTDLQPLIETVNDGGRIWPDHQLVKEIANDHGKDTETVIDDVRAECPNARNKQFTSP